MKKKLFALLFTICVASASAQILATANSDENKNILKMSASLFTRSTFQMGYERFFNSNTSFLVAAGLNFKDSEYEKVWGMRTEAQMKFHVYTVVKPQLSHRLYFAPYILNEYYETEGMYYNNTGNSNWQTDTFDAFGGGMLFGWSFSFANRINLDIYTGGGLRKTFNYNHDEYYYDNGVFEYSYSGITPRLGIDLGFWF